MTLMRDLRRWQLQKTLQSAKLLQPMYPSSNLDLVVVMLLNNIETFQAILSAYSLAYYLNSYALVPKFCFIGDGSLTIPNQLLLQQIFVNCDIRTFNDFRTEDSQKGGCWERLYAISQYSQDGNYVIELDPDTITFSAPDEVAQAIISGTNFTLAMTGKERDNFNTFKTKHSLDNKLVTAEFERRLWHIDSVPHSDMTYYVSAWGGFCGFAPNSVSDISVTYAAATIERAVGIQVNEWGSEQVAGNLLSALDKNLRVISDGRYHIVTGKELPKGCIHAHFFGPTRFTSNVYNKWAEKMLKVFPKMSTKAFTRKQAALRKGYAGTMQGSAKADAWVKEEYRKADKQFNGAK